MQISTDAQELVLKVWGAEQILPTASHRLGDAAPINVTFSDVQAFVKTCKSELIMLNIGDDTLTISNSKATFDTPALGTPDDMPTYVVARQVFAMATADFKAMMAHCTAYMTDWSRPILTAVNLAFGADTVTAATADGDRLHVSPTYPAAVDNMVEADINLDAATLHKVAKDVTGDTVRFWANADDSFSIVTDDQTFIVPYVGGRFPDFRALIPVVAYDLPVNVGALRDALKTVGFVARKNANSCKITCDGVKLSVQAMYKGQIVTVNVGDVQADTFQWAVDVDYLTDALPRASKANDALTVRVGYKSANEPLRFDLPDGGVRVFMPMRVSK